MLAINFQNLNVRSYKAAGVDHSGFAHQGEILKVFCANEGNRSLILCLKDCFCTN